ncbi:galanin receptor 2a-like [Xenia sp. Carnegie-2017]|uniref:galanin receptor 2a-like n=1 Tax=Xenia sp. Carnegie-2017 TaxID=2897299 RepID=UPI001F043D8E|nr:galanin receptor 2a-like [Xenia sp. Carnegie-2017]
MSTNITASPLLPKSNNDDTRTTTKVIFSFVAILALIGNFMVLILFTRFPKWLKKKHYQCIINLAITDVLTAISLLVVPKFVQDPDAYPIPLTSSSREFYCRIVWSHFIPFSLGITSVYTCLVLAIERWLAVIRPVFYKERLDVRTMRILLVCCWVAGIVFESPVISHVESYISDDNVTALCKWVPEKEEGRIWALAIFLFAGQTLIPCCLIVAAYVHIFMRFKNKKVYSVSTRRPLNSTSSNEENCTSQTLKRATIMMAISSLALILCWLPNQLYFFGAQLGYFALKASIPVRIVGVLVFMNSFMNPIIYGFMNRTFREGYRKLLLDLLPWKRS